MALPMCADGRGYERNGVEPLNRRSASRYIYRGERVSFNRGRQPVSKSESRSDSGGVVGSPLNSSVSGFPLPPSMERSLSPVAYKRHIRVMLPGAPRDRGSPMCPFSAVYRVGAPPYEFDNGAARVPLLPEPFRPSRSVRPSLNSKGAVLKSPGIEATHRFMRNASLRLP